MLKDESYQELSLDRKTELCMISSTRTGTRISKQLSIRLSGSNAAQLKPKKIHHNHPNIQHPTIMKHSTACVHLYTHPSEDQVNIYIHGQQFDLTALLISAARINDNFYNALFDATQFIINDEAYTESNS